MLNVRLRVEGSGPVNYEEKLVQSGRRMVDERFCLRSSMCAGQRGCLGVGQAETPGMCSFGGIRLAES
jgi:hypothetical protein